MERSSELAPTAQEQAPGEESGRSELKGENLQLSRADSMKTPGLRSAADRVFEWNEDERKMMHDVEKSVAPAPNARGQKRTAKEGRNQQKKLLELARLQLEHEKIRAEADRMTAHNTGSIFKLLLGEHGTVTSQDHSDSEIDNTGVERDLLVAEPVSDPFLTETSFASSASSMPRCIPTSMLAEQCPCGTTPC